MDYDLQEMASSHSFRPHIQVFIYAAGPFAGRWGLQDPTRSLDPQSSHDRGRTDMKLAMSFRKGNNSGDLSWHVGQWAASPEKAGGGRRSGLP